MSRTASYLGFFLVAGLVAGLIAACSHPSEPAKTTQSVPKPGSSAINPLLENQGRQSQAPDQVFLTEVANGSLGPRLVLTQSASILAWITPTGPEAGYYSLYLPPSGQVSEKKKVAEALPGLRQMETGPIASGTVAVATVRREGRLDILEVLYLGPEGESRGGPHLVAEVSGSVLWTRVAPSPAGGLLFWAEREGAAAAIYAAELAKEGPRENHRIVSGISAWQLSSQGSAITLVSAEGPSRFSIKLRQLGAKGQVIGAPVEIARGITGGLDLDMVMTRDQIVVLWSQKDGEESRLHRVITDRSANVLHPNAALTKPRGEQALVGLLGSEQTNEVEIIWDEPLSQPLPARSLLMASLLPSGKTVTPTQLLELRGSDPLLPSLARFEGGFALVTEASVCLPSSGRNKCPSVEQGRVALKRGKGIAVTDLRLASGELPSMVWDLSCSSESCFALVADNATPTGVYLAELANAEGGKSPLTAIVPPALPRLVERQVLSEVPELASLSGMLLEAGEGVLLSWLSYFDPTLPYLTPKKLAPDGRRAPVRALLKTIALGGESRRLADSLELETTVISYRARSLGGVDLVDPKDNRSLLVWAALDGASPQLFATLIDGAGRKIRQKMLTRHPGEISDVAAVRVPDGFLLAWVDGRGASPQIYTQVVDTQLRPKAPAVAVTVDAASPTGVSLASVGEQTFLVWADSRAASNQSDIYSLKLDSGSGSPQAAVRRLVNTTSHSHSPRLGVVTDASGVSSLMCSWVEAPLEDGDMDSVSRLFWAELNEAGAAPVAPQQSSLQGSVVGFSLDCEESTCRALVSTQGRQGGSTGQAKLWGALWKRGGSPQARVLLSLRAEQVEGVTPFLVGREAFFADRDSENTRWLLHRARIDWGDSP